MANPQRSTTIVTEVVGDGLGVFDSQSQQSYMLNATSALVFQHADGQTTPQQLTDLVRQKFNVSRSQADTLTGLALDQLQQADLVQGAPTTTQAPRHMLSRRQMLSSMAAAGLALALAPIVAPITVQAGTGNVIPTLQCVEDNGDGTYTAYFGYINTSGSTVVISYDPNFSKNMFTSNPKYRGQPDTFEPGVHEHVFSVVFDGSKITWMIKDDNSARQKVDADANSGCLIPPTTTTLAPPTTTSAPPTTTLAPPTTTSAPPTTTPFPTTPPTPMPE